MNDLKKISDRKFWRYVSQVKVKKFNFNIEFKRWLWKKPETKQLVLELYMRGHNLIQIAVIYSMTPLKVRRIVKEMRRSFTWSIKTNKLLEV